MNTPHPLDNVSLVETKLSDQVYDVLRDAIVNGDLLPNARLVERELADRLRISRTPVREAILRLDHDGYVTPLATRGVVVRSLSGADIDEIFGLRIVLDVYAARRAAAHVTPEDIAELETICRESGHCVVLDRPQHARDFVVMDTKFHDCLEKVARSRRLSRMTEGLRLQVLIYRVATLHDQFQRERSLQDHWDIVDALKRGDADRAEQVMRRHLTEAHDVVLARAAGRGERGEKSQDVLVASTAPRRSSTRVAR